MRNIAPVRPLLPRQDEYFSAIASIWDSGQMTNYGEKTEKLRRMLIDYLGCSQLELFVNGHSALSIAIQALGLHGEAITSPFTFVSTTHAIVQNGLTPVFGDIGDDYNLSPESIERLITPKTSCIITPHIFGIPCDVEAIASIAESHGLKVIYDGAQAFGTKVNGKHVSDFGDVTMFSFHATKVFNTIEGGALIYSDTELGERIKKIRNFGISYGALRNDTEYIGINAKMNEFQAAMGIVNLPHLEHEIDTRSSLAMAYKEGLKNISGIETYPYKEGVRYNYAYFPIRVTEAYGISRDMLWQRLKDEGIHTRKLYDTLTFDYKCYSASKYARDSAHAMKLSDIALDLPIYGALDRDDIGYVCETIRKRGRYNETQGT